MQAAGLKRGFRVASWLALAVPLVGCEARRDPTAPLHAEVVFEGSVLGQPADLAVVGGHLIALDNVAETAVHVVDRGTGRLVGSVGRRGGGPAEFRGPWSIVTDPAAPDVVWVFDLERSRLVGIPLGPGLTDGRAWRGIQLGTVQPIISPVWIDERRLLSPGLFTTEGRLAAFDREGKHLGMAGRAPDIPGDIPLQVKHHAWQSVATVNRARGLIALALRHADRVQVLDTTGTMVAEGRSDAPFDPVFRVGMHGGTPVFDGGEGLRFGYVDVTATPERIFALYSGRRRKDHPGGGAVFGRRVDVFDWSGRRLEQLTVDEDLLQIAVDPAGSTLYGVRHLPEPALVRFALPAGAR